MSDTNDKRRPRGRIVPILVPPLRRAVPTERLRTERELAALISHAWRSVGQSVAVELVDGYARADLVAGLPRSVWRLLVVGENEDSGAD